MRARARARYLPWLRAKWRVATLPVAAILLLRNEEMHPSYRMSAWARIRLAVRMYRNTKRVFTGTSYKAHLAMTAKLLQVPPEVEGVVVECGCFRGGSTANLSIACKLAGRKLIVYDSFEGLPEASPGDRYATDSTEGFLRAELDEVRSNVARLGEVDVCEFRKGWFAQTLPGHREQIALAFLDVDYQASLRDCVLNLWPHLIEKGFVFIDEYVFVDYCALFYSERFWRESFNRPPPGLIGAGAGVALGEFYLGPYSDGLPMQGPGSVAYTRKDLSGAWTYFPDDPSGDSSADGGA
jgi:O-methyltransferase